MKNGIEKNNQVYNYKKFLFQLWVGLWKEKNVRSNLHINQNRMQKDHEFILHLALSGFVYFAVETFKITS